MNEERRRTEGLCLWLLSTMSAILWAGCASSVRLPPLNLQAPGWHLTETAAIWRPRETAPELVGDLLVAVNADGARLVQFSKQGLPLITAQVATNGWQISSTLRPGLHSGKLPAPAGVLWFRLDGLPPIASVKKPWQLTADAATARWTLRNEQTGESLEVLAPPR